MVRLLLTMAMLLGAGFARAQGLPPIHRVQIAPERLAEEMDRLRRPTLVTLPRERFEELIKQAERAEAAGQDPPQLAVARYHATLDGNGLVGRGEWEIDHRHELPGRLPLGALQIALRSATWADDQPALIGPFADKVAAAPELLVERKGRSKLMLEWSARGVSEPGALVFDLRFPPAPICALELDLPANHAVQADRESAVLSGPLLADRPDQRRWRLVFSRPTGAAQTARLTIRRPPGPQQPQPLLRTAIQTTQKLLPGQVECEYLIDVQVQRGTVQTLTLECAAGLRPLEVEVPWLEGWSQQPGQDSSRIEIRLREPFQGGRVTLRALAPLTPPERTWVSPAVRLAGALSRGERLIVQVHPDLVLEDWKPGGFRPMAPPAGESTTSRVLALQSRDIGPDAAVRPQARVRPAVDSFQTRETWDWLLEPTRTSLSIETRFTGQRGALIQSSWQIPAGWEVEQVETRPADPALQWRVQPNPSTLIVEPGRPWQPGAENEAPRLLLRLRGPAPTWAAAADGNIAELPIPAVTPLGVAAREGTLTVRLAPGLTPVEPAALRPGNAQTFRGAPAGTVAVRQPRGRLAARCDAEFLLTHDRPTALYRLVLNPSQGLAPEVLLRTSASVTFRSWQTQQGVARVQSIEPAGAVPPMVVLPTSLGTMLASLPLLRQEGRTWRIVFDRMLAGPVQIELRAELPPAAPQVAIPLLSVPAADRFTGTAAVRFPAGEPWHARTLQVAEGPTPDGQDGWAERHFVYDRNPVDLTMVRANGGTEHQVQAGPATLLVRSSPAGRTVYAFRFSLGGWMERTLPVTLPAEAELISLRVDGLRATALPSYRGESTVLVPWRPDRGWVSAELVYAVPDTHGAAVGVVRAESPQLPVAVDVKRTWRLPAGWLPLALGRWQRLPGGPVPTPTLTRRRIDRSAIWDQAIRRWPPQPGETLGGWLQRIAAGAGVLAGPIVLDALASGDLAAPAAEQEPLVALMLPQGLLLTTPVLASRWVESFPEDVAEAVAHAVSAGRDPSGRFQRVLNWHPVIEPPGDIDETDDGEWADWQPAGDRDPVQIWIVSWWMLPMIGIALAALLAVLAVAWRQRRSWVLAAGLGGAGALLIWLPISFWPVVVPALGVSLFCITSGLVAELRRWRSGAMSDSTPSATAAAALVLAVTLVSPAASPTPVTVYLVKDAAGTEKVLAPPELIESLRTAAASAMPTSPVLLDARFEGDVRGSSVRWTGRFRTRVFREGQTALTLDLPDVQLLGAAVDGREALPRPAAGKFTIDLGQRGDHLLELRFTTPITGEADRDVRFTIPDLPIAFCSIELPSGASAAVALSARGAQRFTTDGRGPKLQADLGRAQLVHLRWRQPVAANPPRVPVQATHLWELGEAHARLLSVVRFRFGATSARAIELDVPPELVLANVSLRLVDDPLGLSALVGLSDWQRTEVNGRYRHRLELRVPLAGQVRAEMELIPRNPLAVRASLPVPEVAGEFDVESAVAIRSRELQVTPAEVRGWQRSSSDEFLNTLWQPLRVEALDREPELAFRRTNEPDPLLTVDIKPLPPRGTGEQRLSWIVGPNQADLQARASWSEAPPSGPLEWDVPAEVRLTEVRGEGVQSWSRSGSRLQVWLEPRLSGRPVNLQLSGWLPQPAEAEARAREPFIPPQLALVGLARPITWLEVQARDGWRLRLNEPGPFRPLPSTDLPGERWAGIAEVTGPASFALLPARGRVTGDVLTLVKLADRQLTYQATLDVTLEPTGDDAVSETLFVEVGRSGSDRPRLLLPPGLRLREGRPTSQGFAWVLDGFPGRYRVTVEGRGPVQESQHAPLVTARGPSDAMPVRRWLVLGPGLRVGEVIGVQPAPLPESMLEAVPKELLAAEVPSWAITGDSGELLLSSASADARSADGIAVATVTAAPDGQGRWLMRSEFQLLAGAGPRMLLLPAGAELLEARCEAGMLAPESGDRVPLPAERSLRMLRVTWRTLDLGPRPRFDLPRITIGNETIPLLGVTWTVLAPPGMKLNTTDDIGPARAELYAAADLVALLRQAGPRLSSDAAADLRGLAHEHLKRAELWLAGAPITSDTGPDGQPLADWLSQLRAAVPVPSTAPVYPPAHPDPLALAFARGAPHHWHTSDASSLGVRPEIGEPAHGPRIAASVILALIILIGLMVTSRSRR